MHTYIHISLLVYAEVRVKRKTKRQCMNSFNEQGEGVTTKEKWYIYIYMHKCTHVYICTCMFIYIYIYA